MFRSQADPASGTGPDNPRAPINNITAFIDASGIYGSNLNDANWLRMYSKGKLKMSDGKLLPYNTVTGEYDAPTDQYAPSMAMPFPFVSKWFISGDARANENPCLTSLHTLFTREHNRICAELLSQHPGWSDETLYQEARRRVSAEIQAITYEEWLPQMGLQLPAYQGYESEVNPQIMNVFSGAAFRYGHTTINNMLQRMNNEGHHMPEGDIMLRDAYFNPQAIKEVNGVEPYLIGMTITTQQDFDCKVIDDLRNFYELKVHGGEIPDQIRLQDSEIQRAYETENFFLVLVGNVEASGAPTEVRVITDPVNKLNRSVTGHITFTAVRSAKSFQYFVDTDDEASEPPEDEATETK